MANAASKGCGGVPGRGGPVHGRATTRGRGSGGRGRGNQQQYQRIDSRPIYQVCYKRGQRIDSRPICQVCYKRGHMASDCSHIFDEDSVADEKLAATASAAYGVDTNWYIDLGRQIISLVNWRN